MTVTKNRTEIKGAGGKIVLYRTKDGRTAVDVRLDKETVWLTQKNMAVLFTTDRSVITKHLNNIFQSGELQRESNVQKMHIPGSDKPVAFYSLDTIISVGYRVNSRRGTEFRIWATQVLKDHIINGYTLNERRLQAQVGRLKELQNAVDLMGRIISERSITGSEADGLLRVITDYSLALSLLDQYDHQQLRLHGITETSRFVLTCEAARGAVSRMAKRLGSPANGLVGKEKDKGLESAIGAIYQTFGGRDQSRSLAAQRDRRRRKWLMEGNFADAANNHGFKRSRWRRLWNQKIQDFMIAAVQNVRILLRNLERPLRIAVQAESLRFHASFLMFRIILAGFGEKLILESNSQ